MCKQGLIFFATRTGSLLTIRLLYQKYQPTFCLLAYTELHFQIIQQKLNSYFCPHLAIRTANRLV